MSRQYLDTLDLAKRLAELQDERQSFIDKHEGESIPEDSDATTRQEQWELDNSDEFEELKALEKLESEVSEWSDGNTLIPESEFEDYARELADDIGAVPRDLKWPCNHINWDFAAEQLKQDYSLVTFQGEDYYCHA